VKETAVPTVAGSCDAEALAASGEITSVIVFCAVWLAESVTVRVTEKVPAEEYVCVGSWRVELEPSPKAHEYVYPGVPPDAVALKMTGLPMLAGSGVSEEATARNGERTVRSSNSTKLSRARRLSLEYLRDLRSDGGGDCQNLLEESGKRAHPDAPRCEKVLGESVDRHLLICLIL
jgi:hypothetical protein